MTCGNCALTVQKYLEKKGATDVSANAASGALSFAIADEINVQTLFTGLADLGYHNIEQGKEKQELKTSFIEKNLLIISLVFWLPLIAHMFIKWPLLHKAWFQFVLCLPAFFINIFYFGKHAFRSLRNGMPNMDVLVFLGASAAFVYSLIGWLFYPAQVHQYLFFETCASIVTLVLLGNFLEQYTTKITASSLKSLMQLQKTKAKIVLTDSIGKETQLEIANEELKVDDIVLLNTGDKVPADGILIKGNAQCDESMMTGESNLVQKDENDFLIGGTIVANGNARMRVNKIGKNTALSQIITMVQNAQAAKPPMQKLADKISAVFVPVVLIIALVTLLGNYFIAHHSFADSMMRCIAVMVIACPCAMGLATPAAVMVGMARAARNGILVKGGDSLEKFTKIKSIVFDKTGTLTTGHLAIDKYNILNNKISDTEFKAIVLGMELHSSHPIAQSILQQWKNIEAIKIEKSEEIKGKGLQAWDTNGNRYELGSYRLVEKLSTERHDLNLLKNGELIAFLDFKDEIRKEAAWVIKSLQAKGYELYLLSGDRKEKCDAVAKTLGIKNVFAQKLPTEKLEIISNIAKKGGVAMVGDGINDSPALTKADLGISLSEASQIAVQSAQVVLTKNTLTSLPDALSLGKHTFLTIKQNLFWAFFYNIIALPVAAFGFLTPTFGAGIMALSDVVLIANSVRLRYKKI